MKINIYPPADVDRIRLFLGNEAQTERLIENAFLAGWDSLIECAKKVYPNFE